MFLILNVLLLIFLIAFFSKYENKKYRLFMIIYVVFTAIFDIFAGIIVMGGL